MNKTGAQIFVEWLRQEGIGVVFLLPGLLIDALFVHLAESTDLVTVVANQELAAGFMADGYARATNKLGVCLGIGTIGATNMLTAAVTARADGSAVLFVTGNIPDRLKDLGTFQDGWPGGTDDVFLFSRIAGNSAVVRNVTSLYPTLQAVASNMRYPLRFPAHLSIPTDVQEELTGEDSVQFCHVHADAAPVGDDLAALRKMASLLSDAQRPVLLAGPRMVSPDGAEFLCRFAEAFTIPVASTMSAKGILPEDHPLSLGNFGYAGSKIANSALLDSDIDLLLILGAEFNERDSLCWDERIRSHPRQVIRVDPKPDMYAHDLKADIDVAVDCVSALSQWLAWNKNEPALSDDTVIQRKIWVESLTVPSIQLAALPENTETGTIPLDEVVQALRLSLPVETNLVVDAGLHRIFAGRHWQSLRPGSFFSACGLAPIGWAIAAAIGIKLARPDQPVAVLTGDGCMRAHGGEIATMVRYGLPILIIVSNNSSYESVHNRQKNGHPAAHLSLLPEIDWVQFGRSLGADGARATTLREVRDFLEKVLASGISSIGAKKRPFILEVMTPIDQRISDPATIPAAAVSGKSRYY